MSAKLCPHGLPLADKTCGPCSKGKPNATNKVYRYRLIQGICHDTGHLPCPRCRSSNINVYSHPACGVMVTCLDCGGRDDLQAWNDGELALQLTPGADTYHYAGGKYKRPPTDLIIKTTRARALKLSKTGENK